MSAGLEMFRAYTNFIDGMSEEVRGYYLRDHIERCMNLKNSAEEHPYFKLPIRETTNSSIMMIFWAPGAHTRPHRHLEKIQGGAGSQAIIRVLKGALARKFFAVWEEDCETLGEDLHIAGDPESEEFIETPGTIHMIENSSLCDWAVSLHFFEPRLQAMEVYDFGKNLTWNVEGDKDTLGEPPESAYPIWERS